jgi:hypothetical protein
VLTVSVPIVFPLQVYFSLVVITGGFAILTWLSWFVKKWLRYLPVVCGILFLLSAVALGLYNVAGTVAFGKPTSSACWRLDHLDATEAYYMIEGALITIWVTMGVPVFLLGMYIFYHQARELAIDFPSERKLVSRVQEGHNRGRRDRLDAVRVEMLTLLFVAAVVPR